MPKFELIQTTILTTRVIVRADNIDSIYRVYNDTSHPMHDRLMDTISELELEQYNSQFENIEINDIGPTSIYTDICL